MLALPEIAAGAVSRACALRHVRFDGEIQLGGARAFRFHITKRGLSHRVNHNIDFVGACRDRLCDIMPVRICLAPGNDRFVLRFHPDFRVFDWLAFGILHDSFKRARPVGVSAKVNEK